MSLSGVCEDVSSINVARINSLFPFGKTVMKEQGVGLSLSEYNKLNDNGKIAGHIGFGVSNDDYGSNRLTIKRF